MFFEDWCDGEEGDEKDEVAEIVIGDDEAVVEWDGKVDAVENIIVEVGGLSVLHYKLLIQTNLFQFNQKVIIKPLLRYRVLANK